MRRDWTHIGAALVTEIGRDRLEEAIAALEWQAMPVNMDFMNGYAINAFIREFKIRGVSAVASTHLLAPRGLLGIQADYRNAQVRHYIVDTNDTLVPVAADVWPQLEDENGAGAD